MRPPFGKALFLQALALLVGAAGLVLSTAGLAGAAQPDRDGTIHQSLPIDGDSFAQESDCGPVTEGTAWHFVLNNTTVDTSTSTLTATFEDAGTATATPDKIVGGVTHYYVATADGDTLTGASVDTNDGQLQLSHVCDADEGDEDSSDDLECPDGYSAPEGEELMNDDDDAEADNCVFTPVEADCPDELVEGDETPMDTDGDGEADNCVSDSSELECPDGYSAPEGEELMNDDDDAEADNCVFTPVEADCPDQLVEGDETPMDTDGDGEADNCVLSNSTVVPPVTDVDEDVNVPTPTPEEAAPVVEVEDNVVVPVATPASPAIPAIPTVSPAAPATPAQPAVKSVASVPAPQVLGAQVTRSPGALARTGDSTTNLIPFGLGLVLLGFGIERKSKQLAAARTR